MAENGVGCDFFWNTPSTSSTGIDQPQFPGEAHGVKARGRNSGKAVGVRSRQDQDSTRPVTGRIGERLGFAHSGSGGERGGGTEFGNSPSNTLGSRRYDLGQFVAKVWNTLERAEGKGAGPLSRRSKERLFLGDQVCNA